MKKRPSIIIFATVALLAACDHSSSRNQEPKQFNNVPSSQTNSRDYSGSSQMVTCPMCNGTGIFDYMPGDIYAPKYQCPACNGNGVCSTQHAQEAIQAKAQAEAIVNGGYSACGGYDNSRRQSSGRSVYEIENDLRKAYEQLASLEYDYNNCSSGVLKAQYPSMISDQKAYIARLEAELRNR